MTRARQPRAVTAWVYYDARGLLTDIVVVGTPFRRLRQHAAPLFGMVQARVTPLPAKKANLSRSKRTGQAAAGRPGPTTKRRRKA